VDFDRTTRHPARKSTVGGSIRPHPGLAISIHHFAPERASPIVSLRHNARGSLRRSSPQNARGSVRSNPQKEGSRSQRIATQKGDGTWQRCTWDAWDTPRKGPSRSLSSRSLSASRVRATRVASYIFVLTRARDSCSSSRRFALKRARATAPGCTAKKPRMAEYGAKRPRLADPSVQACDIRRLVAVPRERLRRVVLPW
jgi:hypothetical protein